MPELPEVETIVRDLQTRLTGRTLLRAQVFWPRTVATSTPESFIETVRGRKVRSVSRRAKYLVLQLDRGTLLIHLRMTGKLYFTPPETPRGPHEHILLDLDTVHQLRFQDARKFGRWYYFDDARNYLCKLGPEPLERTLTPKAFANKLQNTSRRLKPLLLDQSFIAGLGNIYVDEALWDACLHPGRLAHTLTPAEAHLLLKSIRKVLRRGIRNLGTTLGKSSYNYYSVGGRRGRNQDSLKVFRRTGEPCPRCSHAIERSLVAQRSTHYCPACQKPPAPENKKVSAPSISRSGKSERKS